MRRLVCAGGSTSQQPEYGAEDAGAGCKQARECAEMAAINRFSCMVVETLVKTVRKNVRSFAMSVLSSAQSVRSCAST